MGKVQCLKNLKISGLAIILCYLSLQVYADNVEEIGHNSLRTGQSLQKNQFKYYKLLIKKEIYDEENDLIIQVFADQSADADLYISKKNEKPNSQDNAEWVCNKAGKDTCAINHNYIRSKDEFYIGVTCQDKCDYTLKVQYKKEISLTLQNELQLDFDAQEVKLFYVDIPSQSNVKDEQNKLTSLTFTVSPFLSVNEDFEMYAYVDKDEDNGSSRKDEVKGVAGWKKGQTLRLSEEIPSQWCTDCRVKLIVDAKNAGKYSIKAKTNLGSEKLFQDKVIDDVAFYGTKVCYQYYVQKADTDLQLKLSMYSGIVSYSLNPAKIPIDYQDSMFKFVDISSSSFVVTARERKNQSSPTGVYYICVFPHMTSTYSLKISELVPNQMFQYMDDNYDEVGEVQGKNMSVFMYKVPPLDYEGEDIKLRFMLSTISGDTPQMAIAFCKELKDHKKCAYNLTWDSVNSTNSKFSKAKNVGSELALIIDHDESECQNIYRGECYYTVAIQGQSDDNSFTKFQINAQHSQENYINLKEGQIMSDFVEFNDFKYYVYTLLDKTNVKNVTFRLNSLHGDADLFVSRTNKFPGKLDHEKSSIKQNAMADEVYFDSGDLETKFYVGIYSMQFSTYNLLVKVDRGNANFDSIPLLTEGMPVKGRIHNEKGEENYRFEIKQAAGYEKKIKIQTTPIESKVTIYVHNAGKASSNYYLWSSQDNLVIIDPKSGFFKRDATYYINIVPHYTFWQTFIDNYYSYMITYVTEDQYTYLQTTIAQENKGAPKTYNYYRHFVTQVDIDFSLAMTVFSGTPTLYVSFDPSNKWPNSTKSDLDTKGQGSISGSKGKALQFSSSQLQEVNTACKDIALQHNEPCAIFASVYCSDFCKYSLKLTYDNSGPQQLILGVPQHNILKDLSFNYYYLNVREINTKLLYITLTSLNGNADLYLNFQDNPQKGDPDFWKKPDLQDYAKKSSNFEGQDIIKVKPEDLKDCYDRYDTINFGNDKQCTLLFGVYANKPTAKSSSSDITNLDVYNTRYNLVAFTDIVQIMSHTPTNGIVEQGEYQYYLFEVTCDDCTVIISLSTYASGDPDLYINFDDQSLPTKDQHHYQGATFRSELVMLDNKILAYKTVNPETMKGPYIIGVYGTKKSNYTLSVTQEKQALSLLTETQGIKAVQNEFDMIYYLWYNSYEENDFKIILNVKSGEADILVTNFDESDETQNLVEQMPKSKSDAYWVLNSVLPTTAIQKKELLVTNTERKYCYNCFYIIGILTHEKKTEYTISLSVLDATFINSQLMKIGEVYSSTVKEGTSKFFRFIIDDSSSPFQILQNVNQGNLQTVLSFNQNGDDPITTLSQSSSYTMKKDDKNFQTERMYYLVSNAAQHDCEYSLHVIQEKTIVTLSDGVPVKLVYNDINDVSKLMIFQLPVGESSLQIQVKSNTKDFYPKLYIRRYENIDSSMEALEFPPGGDSDYSIIRNWDFKLGILNFYGTLQGSSEGHSALAINLFDASNSREQITQAEAYLTISTSTVIKMVSGNSYVGQLDYQSSFLIYQVDEGLLNRVGHLLIEFSQCIGEAEYEFYDDPKINSKAAVNSVYSTEKYGKQYQFIKLPLTKLFIKVSAKSFQQLSGIGEEVGSQRTDFIIKVKHSLRPASQNIEYHLTNDGNLDYEMTAGKQKINLTWGGLFYTNQNGLINKVEQTQYYIVATKDKRVRLDSVCALRKEVASEYYVANFKTKDQFYQLNNPGVNEKYYFNVFAEVKIGAEEEADIIPYHPTEIFIPYQSMLSRLSIFLYMIVAILFVTAVIYFCRKTKLTTQQVESEMANFSNYQSFNKDGASHTQRYSSLPLGGRNGVDESGYILGKQ